MSRGPPSMSRANMHVADGDVTPRGLPGNIEAGQAHGSPCLCSKVKHQPQPPSTKWTKQSAAPASCSRNFSRRQPAGVEIAYAKRTRLPALTRIWRDFTSNALILNVLAPRASSCGRPRAQDRSTAGECDGRWFGSRSPAHLLKCADSMSAPCSVELIEVCGLQLLPMTHTGLASKPRVVVVPTFKTLLFRFTFAQAFTEVERCHQ